MSEFSTAADTPGGESGTCTGGGDPDASTPEIRERVTRLEMSIGMLFRAQDEIRGEIAEIRRDNKSTRMWVAGTGAAIFIGFCGFLYMARQIDTAWLQALVAESSRVLEARQSDARADSDRRWQELLETDRRRMQEIRDETGRRVDEFLRKLDERLAGKGSGGR